MKGLALATLLALVGCASLAEVRDEIHKVRPYLPEPAGIVADGVSLLLAAVATKKASSARRRATRRPRPTPESTD